MSDLIKKIYKYPLLVTDKQTIQMPVGAEILTVQIQNNRPMIWVLFPDPYLATEKRTFRVIGAGHAIIDQQLKYIATFQLLGGELVFHVFETDTL